LQPGPGCNGWELTTSRMLPLEEDPMADTTVAVINASTVLDDATVQAAVPPLQIQVHAHFAPAWGIDADLTFVPHGTQPPGRLVARHPG
jgi:hypothetical protein